MASATVLAGLLVPAGVIALVDHPNIRKREVRFMASVAENMPTSRGSIPIHRIPGDALVYVLSEGAVGVFVVDWKGLRSAGVAGYDMARIETVRIEGQGGFTVWVSGLPARVEIIVSGTAGMVYGEEILVVEVGGGR